MFIACPQSLLERSNSEWSIGSKARVLSHTRIFPQSFSLLLILNAQQCYARLQIVASLARKKMYSEFLNATLKFVLDAANSSVEHNVGARLSFEHSAAALGALLAHLERDRLFTALMLVLHQFFSTFLLPASVPLVWKTLCLNLLVRLESKACVLVYSYFQQHENSHSITFL